MKKKDRYRVFIVFLGLMIAVFTPCLSKAEDKKPPNIIMITMDALRADHLGCYGYPRNTSPNIDKLANEGAIFYNCFAIGSGTTFSYPALLTGKYLAIKSKRYVYYDHLLDDKFETLAEYLKAAGYYTAAFINNPHLDINKGFDQGIDYFKNVKDGDGTVQAITAMVLDFLNKYQGNQPLFIWIHYFDPHAPYTAPKEYLKEFLNDKLYKENDVTLKLRPKNMSQNHIFTNWISNGYIPRGVFCKGKYNRNYYIAAYDAEILQADFYLGKLLENVKDDSIIILTADHGESLGEHGEYFSRGGIVYDELVHVPLIIKDNRFFKGGKKISTIVSGVDVVPTILKRIDPVAKLLNVSSFDGMDLLGLTEGRDIERKYIYSYIPRASSIRDTKANVKYILLDNKEEELYFLPDENTNRIKDNSPDVVKIREELKLNLKKWTEAGFPVKSDLNSKRTSLDNKTKERLKSLGYIK